MMVIPISEPGSKTPTLLKPMNRTELLIAHIRTLNFCCLINRVTMTFWGSPVGK